MMPQLASKDAAVLRELAIFGNRRPMHAFGAAVLLKPPR
jgi:hypothetical protein